MASVQGLLERLGQGEYFICAEGYLIELERRGHLQAGAFVPEVVIENPDLVKALHEEFVHCGSDVVEALTFYGHREKLSVVGRENDLEQLNRGALKIARSVADQTATLMAGNICNTTIYTPGDSKVVEKCAQIFKEQILWAVQEKADYIIAESYNTFGEAKLALECIRMYAPGLPAVVTMVANNSDRTYDDLPIADAVYQLEALGADVVGLNCYRGPDSIIPVMKEIRQKCKGPLACLPVPYRTNLEQKTMHDLMDQRTGEKSFPLDSDSWLCSRSHIADFTRQMKEIGVQYLGLCCGNRPYYIRTIAEEVGRSPPASRYTADMSKHYTQLDSKKYGYAKQGYDKLIVVKN